MMSAAQFNYLKKHFPGPRRLVRRKSELGLCRRIGVSFGKRGSPSPRASRLVKVDGGPSDPALFDITRRPCGVGWPRSDNPFHPSLRSMRRRVQVGSRIRSPSQSASACAISWPSRLHFRPRQSSAELERGWVPLMYGQPCAAARTR